MIALGLTITKGLLVNWFKALVTAYVGKKIYNTGTRAFAELVSKGNLKGMGKPRTMSVKMIETALMVGVNLFGLAWLRARIKEVQGVA